MSTYVPPIPQLRSGTRTASCIPDHLEDLPRPRIHPPRASQICLVWPKLGVGHHIRKGRLGLQRRPPMLRGEYMDALHAGRSSSSLAFVERSFLYRLPVAVRRVDNHVVEQAREAVVARTETERARSGIWSWTRVVGSRCGKPAVSRVQISRAFLSLSWPTATFHRDIQHYSRQRLAPFQIMNVPVHRAATKL